MKIENILKEKKKKITPERLLLAEWMEKKHLFTANDVIQNFSKVSRASIFRTLKLFNGIGYLRALTIGENKETSYEVEHDHHHHEHMSCDDCGDIICFSSEDICGRIFENARQMWFQISQHSLNISGRCKKCGM